MKRFFTLVLVLGVGRLFSQSTIFSEDFSASTFTKTTDWLVDNTIVYPACNVLGSSGNEKLIGQQANSGTFEEAGSLAINTSTYVNIQVSWNMIRGTSSTPALAFQWSSDAGTTWNTIAYTAPTAGAWGSVSALSLPAAASGTLIYVRWTYTAVGGFVDYVGLDDIKVLGTPSPSYYWKGGANPLNVVGSWGIATDGSGAPPPDFSTANQNFFIQNATTAVLTAAWTLSGTGSVLNVGDGTTLNAVNFTIPSTFALTIGSGAKLNVTNNSTLTIQNTSFPAVGSMVLGSGSTVNFAQSSAVTIWAATYGNLIFSGSGDRSQSTGATIVTGDFTIGASNNYVMVNSPASLTELSGKITCSGNITAAVSNITIDGSTSNTIGTLTFNGSKTINNLILNRGSQTLTLGSSLAFTGVLAQVTQFTNGNFNLNGNTVTFNGAVTFPASSGNGVFIGSTGSAIVIGGSGAITNNLIMDQSTAANRTIGTFSLNRSGSTLTMGTDLIFVNSSYLNGNLNLNGNSLTLNGITNFPASTSNGVFIGSTTSSLTIGGSSGALNNSLLIDQSTTTSKSLGLFTITRGSSTLTLGNNLIVAGTLNPTNGIIDINGTLLTLNGPMSLPVNPTNRGFKGSLTSSVTIGGAGTISGVFFMLQTSSATRALSALTLNRSGETLSIGNTLESFGEILPNAGTLASGGNLFIRSDATNKGRIGPVGGSVTGNVKVETFAAGGNTDWANLGPSGISGLTVASWEGQIPMTCQSCPNDQYSAGGYFVSIQGWDETAAASGTTAYIEETYSSPLTVGKGYWVYLGTGFSTTADMTWTVSGPAVQGTQLLPLTNSGASANNGFNLISNPYASPISWSSITSSSPNFTANVDDAIYVYNADVSGGATSYNGGVQSDPNGIGNTIPMGQGFYVFASSASYNLQIQESNKIKSNAPLLKTASDIGQVVRLKVEDGSNYDMTAIRFHGDATDNFDKPLDAYKLFSTPGYVNSTAPATKRTTISTKTNGVDYSINSLPNANNADAVIPVLVRAYATGQQTITGTDLENLPNSCVELKDKLTNTVHDLKSGPYIYTISDTTAAPRFELRVCADITMSVNELKNGAAAQPVFINNDVNGVYVQFDYTKTTKSTITVTNILGQKIMDTKTLNADKDKVYLDIPEKHQVVFITVTSDNNRTTKKIVR